MKRPRHLTLPASRPVRFDCNCSAERIESVLRSLGAEELQSLLDERSEIEVDCEFCNRRRRFDAVDVGRILAGMGATGGPGSLH